MCTFPSLLPLALVVIAILILGNSSVAAFDNKNATEIPHVARNVKGGSNVPNSTVIKGSYIVLLDAKTSAAKVKTIATGTATKMQTLKKQLIANGTLQASSNDVVNIPTDRIFTKSTKAFLINGVSEAMLSSLRQTAGVISVEPDTIGDITDVIKKGSSTSKNGIRSLQTLDIWGVKRVGGPIPLSAVPNPNAKIFVLSSGISPNTNDLIIDPNLSVNLLDGCNPDQWGDISQFGTAVAGIIASKVVGVVPGATLVAVKVCDDTGLCRTSDAIAGIEYVYLNGNKGDVVTVNFAFSVPSTFFGFSVMNAAVQQTASKGIKFAIAAGNSGLDARVFGFIPASASGVNIYTVSCYDRFDTLCSDSNYGSVVDVGGPGVSIPSLGLSGGYVLASGTGFSAAHIAGLLFANSYKQVGTIEGDKDGIPDPIWVYAGVIPTPAPAPASNIFRIDIYPDPLAVFETSYNLTRISPGTPVLLQSVPIFTISPFQPYSWSTTLSNGSYKLNVGDKGGTGLPPPAYYTLSLNGAVFKTGGSFRYLDTTYFTVSSSSVVIDVVPSPTLQPVKKTQKPKKK